MRPVQISENMDTVEYPVDQRLLAHKYTSKANEFITDNKDRSFFLHLCHAMPHKPLAASVNFYTPETPDDLYTYADGVNTYKVNDSLVFVDTDMKFEDFAVKVLNP